MSAANQQVTFTTNEATQRAIALRAKLSNLSTALVGANIKSDIAADLVGPLSVFERDQVSFPFTAFNDSIYGQMLGAAEGVTQLLSPIQVSFADKWTPVYTKVEADIGARRGELQNLPGVTPTIAVS